MWKTLQQVQKVKILPASLLPDASAMDTAQPFHRLVVVGGCPGL